MFSIFHNPTSTTFLPGLIPISKMCEIAARSFPPCQHGLLPNHFSNQKWRKKLKKRGCWNVHAVTLHKSQPLIKSYMSLKPATYSSRITTDIPLYEIPGASFDLYLEDKPRVFEAIFPDKRRSQQLNEEEWRIQMLPIDFLFRTVWPVVDMRLRCKSRGNDYPIEIPQNITKVLELDITKWELKGLDNVIEPSEFSLEVKGVLYPDRRGIRSRLKGQLEMKISFLLPPLLDFIPEDVRQNVAKTVLTGLVENMKQKVNSSLLADYGEFKRKTPKTLL